MAIKLTTIEKETALWKKISKELAARLQALRESNDGNLDAEKTARTRGQIAMCKEVLDWEVPSPEIN